MHAMFVALAASLAVAGSADISLKSADGTALHGAHMGPMGADSGVVLVHMAGRSGDDWKFVAEKLGRGGLSTVSIDLRGHGASATSDEPLTETDYAAMEGDVEAAIAWLRESGTTAVACAGASLGANLCVRVAARDPKIVNLVMLSPALKKNGLTTAAAMSAYGDRPVLLVASAEERYDGISAEKLEARAGGQKHLELLSDAGHGTKMLNREPALEGLMLSWLMGTYELAGGDVVRPSPASGGGIKAIETEGKSLEDLQ
jgi:pimeloyl-ACP methyl ester carboxylesterase